MYLKKMGEKVSVDECPNKFWNLDLDFGTKVSKRHKRQKNS